MIHVSDHAIDRYIDRVKPCFTRDQAADEIRRLLETVVGFCDLPPDWHDSGQDREPFELYAMVGDGIAFGIKGGVIVTTLTRGSHSDDVRGAWNRRRAARRGATAKKRLKRGDRRMTHRDQAGKPRRKDWDAAA